MTTKSPAFFTWSICSLRGGHFPVGKLLASSLGRSIFSGFVHVLTPHEGPVFRLRRANCEEFSEDNCDHRALNGSSIPRYYCLAKEANRHYGDTEGKWIVFAHPASVCLRNIDHMFTGAHLGDEISATADLLLQYPSIGEGACRGEALGLMAIRSEFLGVLTARMMENETCLHEISDGKPDFMNIIMGLKLRIRRFERGEVYAPKIGSIDWELLRGAAFVTVPDWPEKEQWSFLQSLYFGTYFGDDTGLMLNIFDP